MARYSSWPKFDGRGYTWNLCDRLQKPSFSWQRLWSVWLPQPHVSHNCDRLFMSRKVESPSWIFPCVYLPTAYVVRGKVMFWHASVHPSVCPHLGGLPRPGGGGGGGTPARSSGGGYLGQVQPRWGYLIGWYPTLGTPPIGPGWGYPSMGVPHPR